MASEVDSQRFRSTSRQRSEQNGREASAAGLPQIGHGFPIRLPEPSAPPPGASDPPPGAWPGPASLGGLAGIQPAESDRETLAAQERDRFVQRQPHHIGVGADQLDHERAGDALDGVATGFAAPFAGAYIGLN